MFNFNELDYKKLQMEANRDAPMWGDKCQFLEEEKESDDMQIDSSSKPQNYK